MVELLSGTVGDLILKVLEATADYIINYLLLSLYDVVFDIDKTLGISVMSALQNALRTIGVAFITLKFLRKGFGIYVLWSDGDPESPPMGYLVNYIRAMAVAMAFVPVFDFFVDACRKITNSLLQTVGLVAADTRPETIFGTFCMGSVLVLVGLIIAI
jgi:hypothetical protein